MRIASFRRTNVFAALVAAALSLALSLAPSAARADAVDDITKAGVIKVGVFGDFPPFSSVSPDMSLKGYDVDVAQILADALKVKPSLVTVTGQNRIPYLTEHREHIRPADGGDSHGLILSACAGKLPALLNSMRGGDREQRSMLPGAPFGFRRAPPIALGPWSPPAAFDMRPAHRVTPRRRGQCEVG